ncbi:unnamed protein product [Effrenium voratum]|nr:unnamed protein product [Effrenium voratum]
MLARTLVITISALAASRAHEACENGGTECADVWDVQGMLQLASPASAPAAGFPKRKGTKKKHPKHSTPTPISKKKFTPEVWAPIHEAVRAPVQLTCEGESFLSCWTFFTASDPTHGDVEYVSEEEAKSLGLFQVNEGVVHLGSLVGQNGPAKSIRLQSANRFGESHIFVIDIKHMPTGLGTWPAWWSYGPDWPNNGEIDTIETVNIEDQAQSTLHTSYGCRMPMVSGIFNPDCNSEDAYEGCGLFGPSNSGGPPFNSAGGGVFATQWISTGIKMWFWKRADIPSDITSDSPDSTSWGEPYVFFPFGDDCPSSHFKDHVLTINLDFCGDWAGNVFPGGLAKCVEYIQDPANADQLKDAYWDINYVKVFAAEATMGVSSRPDQTVNAIAG